MRARLLPLLVIVAAVACDDATAPRDGALTSSEVTALSDVMVSDDYTMTGEIGTSETISTAEVQPAADPITSTTTFTHTRTCPAGGQIVVEGTRERTWDRDTRSGTMDLSLTKTHEACARTLQDVTVTLNGNPDVQVEAHHAWADGAPVGLQTLTIVGSIAWSTDDGRAGTCTIDVRATFDPDTRTRTVSGTFCDRTFERTTTWSGGRH